MGKDHTAFGRARHPWLTGTGSWMYVAATKYILGVQTTFNGLKIDPCVPSDWKDFEVVRKWRGAVYNIKVKNPDGVEKGIKSIKLNGKVVNGIIPVQDKDTINEVEVVMGL